MFKFVDLFCGIGGFHIACASQGGKCVMAVDIDPQARMTYKLNYGIEPESDILQVKRLPKCDIVCAGFPCVTFSTIGHRSGIEDPRGRLFFEVIRLLKTSKPKYVIFENVKGLLSMPREFESFKAALHKAGYKKITHRVYDAQDFGVPQHRERVFIVATRCCGTDNFDILLPPPIRAKQSIFDNIRDASLATRKDVIDRNLVSNRFKVGDILNKPILTNKGRTILRAKLNQFINRKLFSSHGIVGTLCATFIPHIYDEKLAIARRMTPMEMLCCQGFPRRGFTIPYGRSAIARLSGNAVCVPVATHVVKSVIQARNALKKNGNKDANC